MNEREKTGKTRPDPYDRKPGVEPTSTTCQNVSSIKAQGGEAEKQAKIHVDESPTTNCCTISGDTVTKWKLKPSSNKVELMKSDNSGIIFFYRSGKLNV